VEWRQALERGWASLRLGEVKVESDGGRQVFEVQVYLDDLDPNTVRVELYADGLDGEAPVRQAMERVRQLVGGTESYAYRTSILSTRPATDYTVRAIPYRTGVAVPLEEARIVWQR
jgi:starch phosphorylase